MIGKDVGKVIEELATKNGVKVITSSRIKNIQSGAGGKPEKVILENG